MRCCSLLLGGEIKRSSNACVIHIKVRYKVQLYHDQLKCEQLPLIWVKLSYQPVLHTFCIFFNQYVLFFREFESKIKLLKQSHLKVYLAAEAFNLGLKWLLVKLEKLYHKKNHLCKICIKVLFNPCKYIQHNVYCADDCYCHTAHFQCGHVTWRRCDLMVQIAQWWKREKIAGRRNETGLRKWQKESKVWDHKLLKSASMSLKCSWKTEIWVSASPWQLIKIHMLMKNMWYD